jgi:hypothetical protein
LYSLKFAATFVIKLNKVKHILITIALIAILFHSGAYTAVFVNFQINQSYISTTLCENRFSPELNCAGKCYLKKQFNTQSQQETESGMLTVQQNLVWLSFSQEVDTKQVIVEASEAPIMYLQSLIDQHHTAPRPHPPCEA